MEGFNGLYMASWLARAVLLIVPSWVTGFSLTTLRDMEETCKQRGG